MKSTMTISLLEKPSDDRRASAFLAGWNVTNLIQGTGILGVPYAVRMGGWAAVAANAIVALLCCYTGKLLIECLYEKSKRTGQVKRVRVNYPEVGEAVWPGWGNRIVSLVQFCEMFGGVISYLVLLGTIFTDILHKYAPYDMYTWTAISACVALPALFIRRVSVIAWISMVSVFALMSSIITIIIYSITQYKDMSIANIPPFDINTFPVGFGVIVFSYTAHAVFPGVEGSMKRPDQYPMMMNIAFLLAAIVKVAFGLLPVLRFGADTDQAITVNLKTSPAFYILANALVVTNVFTAFPIVSYIVLETFDHKILPSFPHLHVDTPYHWVWIIISRPLVLSFGLLMAIVVPHFGLFMGLVGSFTGTCLCFMFPCIFHMVLKWNELKWYNIVVRVTIIILA
ncbi:hypothetical protein OS493_006630 [Desmophyllum pertusum]|uniref:Amino acid transporter transmembrane domain-containing protein n=1 Tax=Desmophyllum pertusum TaxID=174260 RepID=A0A9W9ZT46_9CNID|nr:hypothetical protein OS493_006630 [Desmophyllum pertusum]